MSKKKIEIKEIDTIYDYYDMPLSFLFTREDKEGVFYAHWLDEDEDGECIYWVIEVNKELVTKAEKKELTLREFMTHPTNNTVEIEIGWGETKELSMNKAEKNYKDCLPDEDVYLLN